MRGKYRHIGPGPGVALKLRMRSTHCAFLFVSLLAAGCSSASDPSPSPTSATPDGGTSPDPEAVPSTCAAPTKGPTTHGGSVMTDETWTADTSPHILPYDTGIYAKVTLEPCATVLLAPKAQVTVRPGGALVGEGTASKRISIGARDAGKPFSNIRNLGGVVQLTYATIEGGGDPLNTQPYLTGALVGQVNDLTKPDFALKNVTVRGSMSNGIVLTGDGHFSDDSSDLIVTGSAQSPISTFPRAVGSIPTGTFTGNAHDQILLPGSGVTEDIITDQIMHNRGVPYQVGNPNDSGQLRVGRGSGTAVATLTIEAGVTVRFKKGGVFEIDSTSGTLPATGALIARGTAANPITFTSGEASPSQADWLGLTFGGVPDARDVADHIVVEYAGLKSTGGSLSCAPGMREHAVHFSGGQPGHAFITNSTIAHSTNGINSGWRGTPVDFTVTNTFDDVPGCKLTSPPDPNNSCAGRPACAVQ